VTLENPVIKFKKMQENWWALKEKKGEASVKTLTLTLAFTHHIEQSFLYALH
jgi:hypothetical protein